MINTFKGININRLLVALVVLSITMFSYGQSYTTVSIVEDINKDGSTVTIIQPAAMDKKVSRLIPINVPVSETAPTSAETPKASDSEGQTKTESHAKTENHAQADTKTPGQKVAGFRVQIFSDNNQKSAKANAESRKGAVSSRFPEYPVYITFNSPYWRVKVGDFRYKTDAEHLAQEIRNAFPGYSKDVRVVREYITVR